MKDIKTIKRSKKKVIPVNERTYIGFDVIEFKSGGKCYRLKYE